MYLQKLLVVGVTDVKFPCLCFCFAVECAVGFHVKGGNHTICFKAFQLLEECEI